MSRVVCLGQVFLDLTFVGLGRVPRPGEERFAAALHASPGGIATVAVAAARLGLRAAVVAPVCNDVVGRQLRSLLEAEGVVWEGQTGDRTAVTVVMPVGGDRAMATHDPGFEPDAELVERLDPCAVVLPLELVGRTASHAPHYALASGASVDAGRRPFSEGLHVVLANCLEALRLTGATNPEQAALSLSEAAETAVVTLGADGAVAASNGQIVAVEAPWVDAVDTTGAGDAFAAAYVWADLRGLPLHERLRWATLYAALSTTQYTASGGAVTLADLEAAGLQIGLAPTGVRTR